MSIAVSNVPRLRLATLDDYERIVALEASNNLQSMRREDWRNLWLANPLWPYLGDDWTIGWLLENADGRLVGSLVNIPSTYQFRGQELLCANGRGWVVDPAYRSFALSLMGEYFGQSDVDLYVNTTVGPNAAPVIGSLSERIPRGDFNQVAYFATGHRPLAAKGLRRLHVPGPIASLLSYPAALALRCKDARRLRALPQAPAGIVVQSIDQFDDRFDAFWHELVRQNPDVLLGVRDRTTLAWHFAAPLRRGDLRIFTASRGGLLRGFLILKRQDPEFGLNRFRLVDFQSLEPGDDLLPGLLRAALARCRREGVHVVEHLGCDLPRLAAFEQYAPYRRTQACWPFYYLANNPHLAEQLADPNVWQPSVFDGDSSFD